MADFGRGPYYNNNFAPPPPPRLPGIGIDEALLGHASVHSRTVNAVSWNINGKRLATASDDKTARVYEVDENSNPPVKPLAKLEAGGSVVRVCWDPTSPNRLATLSVDREHSVKVWDIRTCKPTSYKLPEECLNMAWSPDGNLIAVGAANGLSDGNNKDMMILIDLKSGEMKTFMFPYQVEGFCFSPNSQFVVITTENGTLEILKCIGAKPEIVKSIQAHTGNCYCVDISPDGTLMAVGSKAGLISVWSLEHLVCLRTIGDHVAPIKSISFSPDGTMLASSDNIDTCVHVSDLEGRQLPSVETGGHLLEVVWQRLEGSQLIAVARDTKGDKSCTNFVRLVTFGASD